MNLSHNEMISNGNYIQISESNNPYQVYNFNLNSLQQQQLIQYYNYQQNCIQQHEKEQAMKKKQDKLEKLYTSFVKEINEKINKYPDESDEYRKLFEMTIISCENYGYDLLETKSHKYCKFCHDYQKKHNLYEDLTHETHNIADCHRLAQNKCSKCGKLGHTPKYCKK